MRSLLSDNQHEYSDRQIEALVAINVFGALLSLFGALFVIINYCLFVSLRKIFAFRLVLMIGISDLILSISNLMGAPNHGSTCYVQAILQQIGDISGILWVVSVSWTINKLTKLTRLPTKRELNTLYLKMNIIIWSVTLIMTVLPFTTSSYGVAGGWCWIMGYESIDIMWRYLCFYIPLWIAIIYMIVIYVKVFRRLKESTNADIQSGDDEEEEEEDDYTQQTPKATTTTTMEIGGGSSRDIIDEMDEQQESVEEMERKLHRKQNNTLQRMKFYPMILIFCYTFATIRRVVDWATVDQTPFFLAVLHTFFAAIPGFLNAIVYGFTKDVKRKDKEFLNEHCGCNFQLYGGGGSHEQIINEQDSDDDNL